MRKAFICIIISLLLLVPSAYAGFWYFSAWKARSALAKAISFVSNEEFDISYGFDGFPSRLVLHVANPKFSNGQLTVSFEELLVESTLLDKSVYISVPNNKIDISLHTDKKRSITCNTNDKNRFVIKLNNSLSSLKPSKDGNITDYINTLRYEDYGLTCGVISSDLKNQITTEADNKNNYIQFAFNKEPERNAKLWFGLYIYRYKSTSNPGDHLNIDTKVDYEFITEISASSVNFNIEKFLIRNDNFSLTANGKVSSYNLATSSFKDKIDVYVSNYKELLAFTLGKEFSKNYPKASSAFEELMLSLSQETTDKNVQFAIKYDDNVGSSFIGKLPATDFMDKLDKIDQLTKNESSS